MDREAAPSIVAAISATSPPSGRQYEINFADQRAVVVEVGGGLRIYECAQGAVLDGYGVDEMCSGGRGQPLIPWPNRVRDGQYEFDSTLHQLSLSEPEAHNAIHGLVRWANWSVADRAADRVVVEHQLHPQPGWPGTLSLQIEYALGAGGLSVRTTATNVGSAACPFGAGQHPYLTLGQESIDSLVLQIPGQRRLEADERGIPTGSGGVSGTNLDYTEPRRLGEAKIDTAYTDLARDGDGLARVVITTADGGRQTTLWADDGYRFVMVFTGDTLARRARRRGLAVEPMTCAPNAFRSGDGLLRLEPGASFSARWGITSGSAGA
jgi:aldose 1-epimerase